MHQVTHHICAPAAHECEQAARQRPRHLTPDVARHASDVRHFPQLDSKLCTSVNRVDARTGNALPEPPAKEVLERQSRRRHKVPDSHARHIEPPHASRMCPGKELGLLLPEQRPAPTTEVRMEPADAVYQLPSYRHVDTERHALTLLEHEGRRAVVKDGERSPQL